MDLSATRFDLRSAAEKGAWLQLVDPVSGEDLGDKDDEGKMIQPCRIRVRGADSMAYEEAVARTVAMRSKKTPPKKGRVSANQLLEAAGENEGIQAEELAAITLGWENIQWQGEDFPHSHENAVKLYSEHRWIREQVIEFFGDRSSFTGNA